jgi:SpoVK/Ycf46/Vps4 family AAA+-type ATPase
MKDVHMEQVIRNLKNFIQKDILPFKTDDEILEKSLWIFELRNDLKFHNLVLKRAEVSLSLERKATAALHRRMNASAKTLQVIRVAGRFRLNRIEKEILLLMTLARLSILTRVGDLESIQKLLFRNGAQAIAVVRALSSQGRLRQFGLIDNDSDSHFAVSKEFVDSIVNKEKNFGFDKEKSCESDGHITARKPLLTFDQLVLPDTVRSSLEMCITQIKNRKTFCETWGIAKTIKYGIGMTMLFSGPPGTGKSACAEAMAHELNKLIIVVNYAQIQSRWVGETAKNTVRIFKKARDNDAVLFWDEADAMFLDRDSMTYSWEVREVNLLLQELEKFEGVCILATNRKRSLDEALQRRIALKIDFEKPEPPMRKKILEKLIPDTMPLAENINLDELCRQDFSGGEIKNVVLNAARIALGRSKNAVVNQDDFLKAIQMETQGGWGNIRKPFGFSA